MPSRRQYLSAVAGGVASVFAGCASPFSSPPRLDIAVENYRSEPVRLEVEVLRADATDRSEALVYDEYVEVPPRSVGQQEWRAAAVAPARPSRVEVGVGPEERTAHYHYVPDCTAGDAPYEPTVHLVLDDDPGVAFGQTECHGDTASRPEPTE